MTRQKRWCRRGATAAAISLITMPASSAIAQNMIANLNLALDFNQLTAVVKGYTGGSYSLASIVNHDKHANPCMGYGDPKADHSMILEADFEQLSIEVDSGGKDTTLVVKGPNREDIRCAFGKKEIRDAVVSDTNWQQGEYKIWVGSIQPNQRISYRLSVKR